MQTSKFRLIAPPLTPFHDDGRLKLDAIDAYADWLLRTGVDGVFVGGSSGECSSLAVDERERLAERWIGVAGATDLEVMVQVGHACQTDAVQLAAHAQRKGADSVSAHAPNYFKPENVERLIDFLAPIAEAAGDLPFYFYDIPGATGVSLDMVEFLSSAPQRIPNLAGLKYSHLDLMQLQRCAGLNDGEFELLFGCDQVLIAGVVLGARGAIGTTYNIAAPWCRGMIDLLAAGDLEAARRGQAQLVEWIVTMSEYGFLPACKAVLESVGVDCGPVRPPLGNLTTQQAEEVVSRLAEQGLFELAQGSLVSR